MKYFKALILSFAVLASACSTVSKVPEFPIAPAEILQDCQDLQQTDPAKNNLQEILQVVLENYSRHHQCRSKTQAWIEWYNSQKKIYRETLR